MEKEIDNGTFGGKQHEGRALLILLITIAALILLFAIRRAILNYRDYRAVADFSEAMQNYDLDDEDAWEDY